MPMAAVMSATGCAAQWCAAYKVLEG